MGYVGMSQTGGIDSAAWSIRFARKEWDFNIALDGEYRHGPRYPSAHRLPARQASFKHSKNDALEPSSPLKYPCSVVTVASVVLGELQPAPGGQRTHQKPVTRCASHDSVVPIVFR